MAFPATNATLGPFLKLNGVFADRRWRLYRGTKWHVPEAIEHDELRISQTGPLHGLEIW